MVVAVVVIMVKKKKMKKKWHINVHGLLNAKAILVEEQ